MKLFQKLKGLFSKKDKPRKKDIVKKQKAINPVKKTALNQKFDRRKFFKKKNVQHFQDDLYRHKINERRRKKKIAKASKKRNRK